MRTLHTLFVRSGTSFGAWVREQRLETCATSLRVGPAATRIAENLGSYLELANVRCVGGTWLAPAALVAAKQWPKVQELAAQAAALAGGRK